MHVNTTPILYFAASTSCASGVQVTASHNPRDHSGFKLVLAGRTLDGQDIQALRRTIEADEARPADTPGQIRELVVADAYRDRIAAHIRLARLDGDGDGDRLGVVTPSGHIVYPDRQMMLFARDVLSRVPGAPILFDVKSTQRLGPVIAAAGGRPVLCKSGYTLLKARMNELDAPLAGELSGHIFFRERWLGFDDGTYAACRLLEILSRHADPGRGAGRPAFEPCDA